jgi:hypothetical protein
MPPKPAQRPRTRTALLGTHIPDPVINRAVVEVREQIARVAAAPALDRQVVTFDLVVGTNKIAHRLGRVARGYSITPTVADATFAHAIVTAGNEQPDRQVWISVVGVNQPGAILEVF